LKKNKMHWTHYNPVRIERSSIIDLVGLKNLDHILIVTTEGHVSRGTINKICESLQPKKLTLWTGVKSNPDLRDLDAAARCYSDLKVSHVIGVGGGSALDAAKILASTIPTNINHALEKIFRKHEQIQLSQRLPLILIPTTAGSGSEVTPFATVWDHQAEKKYSFAGNHVYPDIAILDPELTLTVTRKDTLFTALDTISHALESIWNYGCTPLSKQYAINALNISKKYLPIILSDSLNLDAREKLQEASTFGGLAISQTKTAIAHALSYPLTSRYGVPHGLACSFSLEAIIQCQIKEEIEEFDKLIMKDISVTLKNLNLNSELQRYATLDEIGRLLDVGANPERLNNYKGNADIAIFAIKNTLMQ
jgi:phosphonate metabolism-associated iron-containing alcohol dehydrogenase